MADIQKFIEEIKGMSVIELNDLVKALEEEFGVSAAAMAVAAPAAGGAGQKHGGSCRGPAPPQHHEKPQDPGDHGISGPESCRGDRYRPPGRAVFYQQVPHDAFVQDADRLYHPYLSDAAAAAGSPASDRTGNAGHGSLLPLRIPELFLFYPGLQQAFRHHSHRPDAACPASDRGRGIKLTVETPKMTEQTKIHISRV